MAEKVGGGSERAGDVLQTTSYSVQVLVSRALSASRLAFPRCLLRMLWLGQLFAAGVYFHFLDRFTARASIGRRAMVQGLKANICVPF